MSAVRSKGTALEARALAVLRLAVPGRRFTKHPALPGRPDFSCRVDGKTVAIFVDSCFWHGCPRHYRRPASSVEYWDEKRARNVRRDRAVNKELKALGVSVVRIWEHALRKRALLGRVRRVLGSPLTPARCRSSLAPARRLAVARESGQRPSRPVAG
jgi:DNA mismatch endonuclease (patch repair protein)